MKFTVKYLADDGEIRWIIVEANSKDEAIILALENDFGNYGGDSITDIISVEQ